MKILLTILFLSLLSSPSWSVSHDDLVEREGIFYKKFSDVPFSGKVTGRYKGNYKNGKEDGAWVIFHDNGQLASKGNYKNGKLDGAWVGYWDDGRIVKIFTGTYKDGVKISD